jgi:hypothetical protein
MNAKTAIATVFCTAAVFATAACGSEQVGDAPAKIAVQQRPAGGHEAPAQDDNPKLRRPGYGHPTAGRSSACTVDPAASRAAQQVIYVDDCPTAHPEYADQRRHTTAE